MDWFRKINIKGEESRISKGQGDFDLSFEEEEK